MKTSYWMFAASVFIAIGCNSPSGGSSDSTDSTQVQSEMLAEASPPAISGVDGNCVAPPEWFTGPVPEPQPQDFPQGEGVTNCDFHLISWQYFLWLTEEVDGKLRFETMYSDQAIYPEHKDDTDHPLDIVEQALSKGVLVDQNNRAVYSSIIINDIYRNWVLNNQLYDPQKMLAFDPNSDFPVGSMSLKANWKIVQPGEDVSKLYTTKANIQLLSLVDGKVRIPDDPKMQMGVEVALVGLHIAVVVEGHPEFIWATFEYDDNAPDFNPGQKMNDPVSDRNWLFYTANTSAMQTNANNASMLSFIDESAQTIKPVTQVARQYKNGGGSSINEGNIEHLNSNVKQQLGTSVWKNFFEVGAIWFNTAKGTLAPNWSPNINDSMVTGSLELSNSTIETFTQKVNSMNECFSCHNTMAVTTVPQGVEVLPGKNMNTSHILLKANQGGGQVFRK